MLFRSPAVIADAARGDVETPLVLAADDDPDILALVRFRLSRAGFRVVTAADGGEALALASVHSFDLAVLDVTMPVLSGLEVAQALRARGSDLPVMLLTARARQEDVAEGEGAGAVSYMTKPFSPQELERRVWQLVGRG